jgi:beta-galactosidase
MSSISFDSLCYRRDGKPFYFNCGEIHYYRVAKKAWRDRMQRLKDVGGNFVATIVPWILHEPSEGDVRFGDEDYRDMEGYLATAADLGLKVVVRAGPYTYTELHYEGLPGWLCENYPQIRAHDIDGQWFRASSVSYLHPLFLEKVRSYFSRMCPVLAQYTESRGGPVVFTQFDNELTGVQIWMGSPDYHAVTMGFGKEDGRYAQYLKRKYKEVGALNAAYGTAVKTFADARPVRPNVSGKREHIRASKDYFDCYLGTIAEYGRTLVDMFEEFGVDTQFCHNSPNGSMNVFYEKLADGLRDKPFILGTDNYYNLSQGWAQNNPTPQYALKLFYGNEILQLMKFPPTTYELPSGSGSDWPPVEPNDVLASYLINLAFGMKGHNYYVFAGGYNAGKTGLTSDTYDWQASIGPEGDSRPIYEVQRGYDQFLKKHDWLIEAERETDCRLAVNYDHLLAENYWSKRGEVLFGDMEAWEFAKKGFLTTAFCGGVSPSLCNIACDEWLSDQSTPVVVVASSSMAAAQQQRVIDFLEKGGKVLLMPVIPTLDENLNPCTILSEYLGGANFVGNTTAFPRINVLEVQNIYQFGGSFAVQSRPEASQVIGMDETSNAEIAWQYDLTSGGRLIMLGFHWVHAMHEHTRMLMGLLGRLSYEHTLTCSNPNIWCALRTAGQKSMLFIMNPYSSPMRTTVACKPAWSRKMIDTGSHDLQAMEVKTVPLG